MGDDDETGQNVNNQTSEQISSKSTDKPIKAKPVALKRINVEHTIDFNGRKIPLIMTYAIQKQYVNNWWFTANEEIHLAIKPTKNVPNVSLGVANVYADVAIVSQYLQINGVRQDSVNQSYRQMPNGFASIDKNNNFDLPFQVESINQNETSVWMINGTGGSNTERINENDLRDHASGAKLNVVWTIAVKQNNNVFLKTIHDSIGLPYEIHRKK